MRFSLRSSTIFLCLLMVPIISRSTFAVRAIDKLIEEAMAATTKEIADEKLDQADDYLDKTRMDDIERDFLRADIKQIRGRIYMTWARNLGDANKQNEAYDLLLRVSDDYEKLVERCEDKAGQSARRQGNLRGQRELLRKSEQNTQRARYKWAWAEYYVADASDTAERQTRFNKALDKFNEFTADGDPNQIYIARCFSGQAHCLYELKRYSEIVKLLDPEKFKPETVKSKDRDTIREIHKNTTLWRVKAYQELQEHRMAGSFAKQYFDTLPEDTKLDATELEMAILWIRSLGALLKDDESLRARINDLSSLVRPYGTHWRTRLAEELDRIGIKTPYRHLNEANKELNSRNYEQALGHVNKGLEEANSDEELSANLRNVKFVALWKLNNWHQAHLAAREFLEHHPADDRATVVCSWGIRSGLEALKSDPPLKRESLLNFLEYAEKNFPENSEAEKIPWYKGYILYQDGQYLASKRTIDTIEPNSPVYCRAQHCLAMASYKQAEAIIETEEDKQAEVTRLLGNAVDALCRFADSGPKNLTEQEIQMAQNAVKLTIETSRCLLDLDSPDPNIVLKLIGRMQRFQDIVHQSEDRWLTQHIKADIMAGNIKSATENVEALLEKAATAKPLIDISKLLERMSANLVENNKNSDAESVDRKLALIYTMLLDKYFSKSTNEQMRANEASARLLLARCYQRLREYQKAIEYYEWYMNNVTKDKSQDIIRSVAITHEKINNYDMALPLWRKLFRGLNKRTNEWIEAGYHQINCHIKTGNRDQARKVLEYINALRTPSDLGEWRQKFQALDEELSTTKPGTRP